MSASLVGEAALEVEAPGMLGSDASRIHDASPVMCTSEHNSAGTDTSSSAAAMAASSSVKGSPTCGFRVSVLVNLIAGPVRGDVATIAGSPPGPPHGSVQHTLDTTLPRVEVW